MTKPPAEMQIRPTRNKKGWQAEKSAMTRKAILDAAVQCFIDLGYANTTTARIAEYANVSRGAMMHHFPSRLSVLRAVIQHLYELRLREYKVIMSDIDDPGEVLDRDRIRASVLAAWKYFNLPSFTAYQELLMASRTDEELKGVLEPVEKEFEAKFIETVKLVFPRWQNLGVLGMANDLVQFLLVGMASSHMADDKEERAAVILEHLTDTLEYLYRGSLGGAPLSVVADN